MISEYLLTKDEIREINETYGGSLRSDAEIETALYLGKGKSVFRKIAYLWKAILVGHPFTDGNKRTALIVATLLLEKCNMKLEDARVETMISEIAKIAMNNILDINQIERGVRYAVSGN